MKVVSIIGSGISGLTTACYLAKAGYKVRIFEKNEEIGGRARKFESHGFTFDMGPSWYWMPDIFEDFFNDFGKKVEDYYELRRLDPSYSIYFEKQKIEIPASYNEFVSLFEKFEPGSSLKLDQFFSDAAAKYKLGMKGFATKPSLGIKEYADPKLLKAAFKMNLFNNMDKHINKYFQHPYLRKIMQFPVIFLGAMPDKIPAMYSLMNYADTKLGTWYPMGGMFKIVESMASLAEELGVEINCGKEVVDFVIKKNIVTGICTNKGDFDTQVLVGSGDYHHIESLLPSHKQSYSSGYWDKRKMAPSCLIYYLGIGKKVSLDHHSLFFDSSFDQHARELYDQPKWPSDPMFYVCATSVTDASTAPENCTNLFILVPIAAGLDGDTEQLRRKYKEKILERLEKRLGVEIRSQVIYERSYSIRDFKEDYHAFKGNAYGLSNTLDQTAFLKPRMKSKKLKNLYYCGQLTVPGPGVPPAIISGKIVAKEVIREHNTYSENLKTIA